MPPEVVVWGMPCSMVTLPLLSDLPMATLSAMYLTNTITECIKSANANRLPPYTMIICDIEPRPYLMYLFRCGLVAAFAAHRSEARLRMRIAACSPRS